MSDFDGRAVDRARIEPLAEIEEAAVRPGGARSAAMAPAAAAPPQPLMADSPKQIFPSGTVNSAAERFTSGGSTAIVHPLAVFEVLDQRVLAS